MREFCTLPGSASLDRCLALHASLAAHAGDFRLHVLADEALAGELMRRALPGVAVLPRHRLLENSAALARARDDRTAAEFDFTCIPWLLRHLLPTLPPGTPLAFVDPAIAFFHPPATVLAGFGTAPAVLVPRDPARPDAGFSSAWVTLRHDADGLAAAARWAAQCAADCYASPARGRRPGEHYLDTWPAQFPGTAVATHPAALAAPRNLGTRAVSAGPHLDGQPLVAFDFGDLADLGDGLFDAGLHAHGRDADDALRNHVYHPYLRRLVPNAAADRPPELVPPPPGDPRAPAATAHLLALLQRAARERDTAREDADRRRTETERVLAEARAREAESERYLHQVEQDRNQQRQSFFTTRQRLEELHEDLLRNIAYLKRLQGEIQAHEKASVDREAYIGTLKQQLGEKYAAKPSADLEQLYRALRPHGFDLRRVLVARYHPSLLPLMLSLAAQGASLEVLDSPADLVGQTRGSVHFLGGNLRDWLGGLTSGFDEDAYLRRHPDVAAAIAAGAVRSGWDHFQRFGQFEGRDPGTPGFRAGFADFDAVALDSADAGPIVPFLAGRLQPHQRLFVSSSFNPAALWLPADSSRTLVLDDLLCCPRPPAAWLGPLLPAGVPAGHRTPPRIEEVYPAEPAQPAAWPKISIIVHGHNQAGALAATLRSVLDQHYPMLELLVVDGGSTDGSVEQLRGQAERLAWWTSEPAAGTAAAVNLALAKATGTLVAWLRAGERLQPGSLFTVGQQFLLHAPDLVIGRWIEQAPGAANEPRRSVLALGSLQPLPLAELRDLDRCWLQDWFPPDPAVFLRRTALDQAGGRLRPDLREAFAYPLWLALGRHGACVLPLPEILAARPVPAAAARATARAEARAVLASDITTAPPPT